MKSCDLAEWLRKMRAVRARKIEDMERFIGEPVHFYMSREQSISDAIHFARSLKEYGLLKPSEWIESNDCKKETSHEPKRNKR